MEAVNRSSVGSKRIDIHSHIVPKNCVNVSDSAGRRYGPSIVRDETGVEIVTLRGTSLGPIARQLCDPETHIKDMDDTGVDIQVLSPVPGLLYYDLEFEDCLWFSRRQNDGISQIVSEYPTHFLGLATIPLQEPSAALPELDRSINKLGLRGVEILSNINGRQLDSPELMPFYKEVVTLDVPIFIHPSPSQVTGFERMKKFFLYNLVGNALDTTLAVAHLIFGGVLDKFPSLRLYLAHGGGYLPYIRGRLEHGYRVRPECQKITKNPPSYYLPLLYYDTVTHFLPALQYLVTSMGADKVMLGTDYPFDMADPQPVQTVESLTDISEEDKQKILGANAARFFRLT